MNSLDIFEKYIEEKGGAKIIRTEDGFITYKLNKDHCFLADMYVTKENRGTSQGSMLLRMLEQEALKVGLRKILASIDISLPMGNETTLLALLKGFKIIDTSHKVLILEKEF